MLNKEASHRRNLWKLGLVLPLLGLFMYSFNVKEVIEYREVVEVGSGKLEAESLEFGEGNESAFAKAETETTSERTFTLHANMSDAQINSLIELLEGDAENLEIRFSKRKRTASGELASFLVETKYPSQKRYYQNVTYGEKAEKAIPDVIFQIVNGNDLQFTDFEEKMIFRTSLDGVQAELFPKSEKPQMPALGENPAYIVNGETKTSQEMKDKIIELDGDVELLGKEEATATYGEKAKDGAFVFNGTATLKDEDDIQKEGRNALPKITSVSASRETQNKLELIEEDLISTQDGTYKFVITKNTTVEELKALKKTLKEEYNTVLKYSNLDFNNEGEITSIKLKYKDTNGNSSNYHSSSKTAIGDIYIYREANGATGIGNYGSSKELEAAIAEKMKLREARREERLEALQGRRQELMEKREVRREEMQKRREEAREEMNQRSEGAREEIKERRKEMEKREKQLFESAKAQERSNSLFNNDVREEIPRPQSATVPLYILDEKEVRYEDLKTILDPNKIKSVSVLKGKSARALYGDKGKNGVVVIESKE